MAASILENRLLRSSVIVTGSHYSMTTLVGRLLAAAPEFNFLHEPANARPTLSFDSLGTENWYQYHPPALIDDLAEFLLDSIRAEGLGGEVLSRMGRIRSWKHLLQVGRYIERKLPMRFLRKPVIIKDPFLLFSAPTLQAATNMRVVLTVRHPCAFAESFMRAGSGFDFDNLLQAELMPLLGDDGDKVAEMAAKPGDLTEQAALLWRILYRYSLDYLVPNDRTFIVRQDQLVAEPEATSEKLFGFANATITPHVQRMLDRTLLGNAKDFDQSGSYIERNAAATLHKWQDRLTPAEIGRVRSMTEEVALQLGYDSNSWDLL